MPPGFDARLEEPHKASQATIAKYFIALEGPAVQVSNGFGGPVTGLCAVERFLMSVAQLSILTRTLWRLPASKVV
jgi:hypothetical protein